MQITNHLTAEISALDTDGLAHLLQDVDHIILMEVLIEKLRTIGKQPGGGYEERRWEAAEQMQEILRSFD